MENVVNELIARKNKLEAEILILEKEIVDKNHQLRLEEVLNLLDMENVVNELIARKNKLEAEILRLEKEMVDKNHQLLLEEVLNLLDGVGRGFTEGDYYAPSRYYSKIQGVKNIRLNGLAYYSKIKGVKHLHLNGLALQVKVYSQSGYLLPDQIEVRGETLPVHFVRASAFTEEMDY